MQDAANRTERIIFFILISLGLMMQKYSPFVQPFCIEVKNEKELGCLVTSSFHNIVD